MKNYLTTVFFGPTSLEEFGRGIQHAVDHVQPFGVFAGDNLFTFSKNLSFLDDVAFMEAFQNNTGTEIEKAIIWRTHVLAWAAHAGTRLEGDFVECGCYKGTSAKILCDYLGFKSSRKSFHLYDVFENSPDMKHEAMPAHGPDLYRQVKERFSEYPNVRVTKGGVPSIFSHVPPPEKIAFLHLDMNNVEAEMGALHELFERLTPGAPLVLDDYGWLYYREQKFAEDRFFAERGYRVLELPTGQGLVIK